MFKLRRQGKREAKWSNEFGRSNSLSLSRGFSFADEDPSFKFFDDTNIEVIISSDHITSSLCHEQTPVETIIAVPYIPGSLKRDLYVYVLLDMWDLALSTLHKFPDMIRIPLIAGGDTALHAAVSANNTTFGQKLVELELMTPADLEIRNADGNTAFCMAAISGNRSFLQFMLVKNKYLPLIPGHDGMLPVHLAALRGHPKIVQDLSSKNYLETMETKHIERLFFMTIGSSMYDVAMTLLVKYTADLATARNEGQLTALHMLARKSSEELYLQEGNKKSKASRRWGDMLLPLLWYLVRQLEYEKTMDLITKPSAVLFDAVKSGNLDVVKLLLYTNPELLTHKDFKGQSLLHYAVLYRKRSIFNFILKMGTTVNLIIGAGDIYDNNILHLAAQQPEEKPSGSSSVRPNIQMQRELVWFKDVEKIVPPVLKTTKNSEGMTPKDIFYANRKKLSEDVKAAAKGMANSGMLVATLIATVAFAAALTLPGDKTNAWFTVFILSNAVALFASSASIISFMSIFTSSIFTESEFILSLHPSLILGLTLLFISIAAMVIAFAAASFLIFDHTSKWVAYVVALLGLPPICLYPVLHFSLFDGLVTLVKYHFWPRCYRP